MEARPTRFRRALGNWGGTPSLVSLCTPKYHPQTPPVQSLPSLPDAGRRRCGVPGELDTAVSGSPCFFWDRAVVLDGAQEPCHRSASHLISHHPGSPRHSLPSRAPWLPLTKPFCCCLHSAQPLHPQDRPRRSKAVPRQGSRHSALPLQKERWIPASHCSARLGSGEWSKSHPCPTA